MNSPFLPLVILLVLVLPACASKQSPHPPSTEKQGAEAVKPAKPEKPALPQGVQVRFYLTEPGTAEPINNRTVRHPETGQYRQFADPPIAATHDISQITKT